MECQNRRQVLKAKENLAEHSEQEEVQVRKLMIQEGLEDPKEAQMLPRTRRNAGEESTS